MDQTSRIGLAADVMKLDRPMLHCNIEECTAARPHPHGWLHGSLTIGREHGGSSLDGALLETTPQGCEPAESSRSALALPASRGYFQSMQGADAARLRSSQGFRMLGGSCAWRDR
jgi:hypothetical protein